MGRPGKEKDREPGRVAGVGLTDCPYLYFLQYTIYIYSLHSHEIFTFLYFCTWLKGLITGKKTLVLVNYDR